MDPNQSALILGLLTNGLYSLILFAGKEVKDRTCSQEDIYDRLTKTDKNFTSIIQEAFQDLPHVVEPEEYCEFL